MKYSQGFTLLELMVIMFIVGILVAIAIPSYNETMRRKDRSVAQQEMLKLAGELERYRAKNFNYSGFTVSDYYPGLGADDGVTANAVRTPIDLKGKKYTITVTPATNGLSWHMIATRVDATAQAQNYDLFLNSVGVRCMSRATISATGCTDGEKW